MKYKNLLIPDTVLTNDLYKEMNRYDFQLFSFRKISQNKVRMLTNVLLPYIKIAIVFEGECEITIQGKKTIGKKGDLFIVPPYHIHSAKFLTDTLGTMEFLFQISGFGNQEQFLSLFHNQWVHNHIIEDEFLSYLTMTFNLGEDDILLQNYLMINLVKLISAKTLVSAPVPTKLETSPIDFSSLKITQAFIELVEETDDFLNVDKISQELHVSQSYLCRCCKEVLDLSAQQFLIQYRLYRSIQLLANPEMKIQEISDTLHYQNVGYFCQQFKKEFLITPTEYRKKYYR